LCNDDSLTAVAVGTVRDLVEFPDAATSSGFGFGWVQDGRSLLRANPKPSSGAMFMDLMADIPARSVVGHIRGPEDEEVATLDLQPFRFRRWVLAHGGEEPHIGPMLDSLLDSIPEFVRGNVKGTTGSEVLAHVFLGHLYQRGLLDEGRTDPAGCAAALAETMRQVQLEAAIASFAAVAVTDRMLVAGGFGHALAFRVVRGLSHFKDQPLFAGHKPKPTQHPTFKGVFVTDAPTEGADWVEVPDGHVMWVDRDWEIRQMAADELGSL